MNLEEYYRYYLSLHQTAWCRRLHFVGQLFTILFVSVVLYEEAWIYLFISPFIVYPFAWSGHFFFEKNTPAAFKNPLFAKICDWVMFKDIITGKLKI